MALLAHTWQSWLMDGLSEERIPENLEKLRKLRVVGDGLAACTPAAGVDLQPFGCVQLVAQSAQAPVAVTHEALDAVHEPTW